MSLLDARQTSASTDIVGIFDENFVQVFAGARPIKVVVREESQVMQHPLETGASIIDHTVDLPTLIDFSMILRPENARNTYQDLQRAWRQKLLFTVQTKMGSYPSMFISRMPREEDTGMFDTVAVAISMQEAQFQAAQFVDLPPEKVANPRDSSTVARGEQTASTASEGNTRRASTLFEVFN